MPNIVTLIYILLVAVLIMNQHIVASGFYSIPKEYVESFITAVALIIAYLTYYFSEKEIKRREEEKKQLLDDLKTSDEKLLESFKYIGVVNVRLPLLKNITSDLLKSNKPREKNKKEIINRLLATATTSIAKTEWGIFRFIEVQSGSTTKEFMYNPDKFTSLNKHISNKELVQTRDQKINFKIIGNFYIVPTSDQETQIQCFFIFPKSAKPLEDEFPVLLAITDQAQLFYKYLYAATTSEQH